MKLFAGLVLQPFVATAVAFVCFPLLESPGRPANQTDAAISIASGAAIVAAFVTVVGVLPTAVGLIKRRHVTLGQALLWGIGFGNFPVLLGYLLLGSDGLSSAISGLAVASLIGLAGAASFWAISLRGQSAAASDEHVG